MLADCMIRPLLLLLILGITGCAEKVESSSAIYFAGEIVNPTDSLVVLFKGEQPVVSARLDAQNRFVIQSDSLESGLYNFRHKPEFQYVYLEEGDSLLVRLNTVAFDESLIFSGKGEEINNFLIDIFLESEGEEALVREYYIPMEPEAFSAKIDSLKLRKLKILEELKEEYPITDGAYHMAQSGIVYQYYLYKEKYPFWHRKLTGDGALHDMPGDFYEYRQQVSYNDPTLTFLRPYHDFMIYHIGNLAYMGCKKECEIDNDKIGSQLHFNRHQLHLIDSLVTGEELRDNLFRTVAYDYLLKNDSESNAVAFMEDFRKVSANNRHSEEIEELSTSIENLRPNHELPDLTMESTTGETINLRDIAGEGPVVFYFWSGPQQQHLANITRRVRSLHDKHKGYRFVGICLRTEKDHWKQLISSYSLDSENQFWAPDFEETAHKLVVYHPYKSILAMDGKIVDGFANLNSSY